MSAQDAVWDWANQQPLPDATTIHVVRDDLAFARIPLDWAYYVEDTIRSLNREGRLVKTDKHAHIRGTL